MKIRTQLKAGNGDRLASNHNEALKVRSALRAGGYSLNHNEALRVKTALKAGALTANHSEPLRVRSTVKPGRISSNHNEALRVRSALKAGGVSLNHNEALRRDSYRPISMRRQPRTTGRKADRLELLVVRAGLRAGRRARR